MNKKTSRIRRSRRGRAKIKALGMHRLCVNRTPRHIYAQIIAPSGSEVLVSASSLEKDVKKSISSGGGNVDAAALIGKIIAERAKSAGIERVAFDRSGYRYHGRVQALAEAAREHGLKI